MAAGSMSCGTKLSQSQREKQRWRTYRVLLPLSAREFLDSSGVDQPVNDEMRDVDTLRAELTGEGLACGGAGAVSAVEPEGARAEKRTEPPQGEFGRS